MIDAINLEVKLKLCTSFIVKEVLALDPLARRQWLFTYKGIIQYADSHGSELTQEQIVGAAIYRDLIYFSMLQSGVDFNPNAFYSIIPAEDVLPRRARGQGPERRQGRRPALAG